MKEDLLLREDIFIVEFDVIHRVAVQFIELIHSDH